MARVPTYTFIGTFGILYPFVYRITASSVKYLALHLGRQLGNQIIPSLDTHPNANTHCQSDSKISRICSAYEIRTTRLYFALSNLSVHQRYIRESPANAVLHHVHAQLALRLQEVDDVSHILAVPSVEHCHRMSPEHAGR